MGKVFNHSSAITSMTRANMNSPQLSQWQTNVFNITNIIVRKSLTSIITFMTRGKCASSSAVSVTKSQPSSLQVIENGLNAGGGGGAASCEEEKVFGMLRHFLKLLFPEDLHKSLVMRYYSTFILIIFFWLKYYLNRSTIIWYKCYLNRSRCDNVDNNRWGLWDWRWWDLSSLIIASNVLQICLIIFCNFFDQCKIFWKCIYHVICDCLQIEWSPGGGTASAFAFSASAWCRDLIFSLCFSSSKFWNFCIITHKSKQRSDTKKYGPDIRHLG